MIGEIFLGFGGTIFLLVMAYWFYQIVKMYKSLADKECKYMFLEEMVLDAVAKKKGYDLSKEMLKRDVFKSKSKSFRKRIEQDIYEEFFGKDKIKE